MKTKMGALLSLVLCVTSVTARADEAVAPPVQLAQATPPPPPPPPPGPYYAPYGYGAYPPPRSYYRPSRPPGPPPGWRPHDNLFVSAYMGFGYQSFKTNNTIDDDKVHGVAGTLGIAIGGAIAPNLVLYGEFMGTQAPNPTFEQSGNAAPSNNVSARALGIGFGAAYYIMPANVYLAGTLMGTQLSISDDYSGADFYDTDLGLGLNLRVGKEWWIGRRLALGLGLQFFVASVKGQYELDAGAGKPTWNASTLAMVFSFTYN